MRETDLIVRYIERFIKRHGDQQDFRELCELKLTVAELREKESKEARHG